jgi:Ca2+-binding RTX toxin-like protein
MKSLFTSTRLNVGEPTIQALRAGGGELQAGSTSTANGSASFGGGELTVTGTDSQNKLLITRGEAGELLINRGDVPIDGGTPTVANTSLIVVNGLGGDDLIVIDERGGAMPNARLSGGLGNDTLIGGSGDDVLIGGDGNDKMIGGAGNDRMIWNPGDDNDVLEGGAGVDTMEFNGANVGENIDISANGARVTFFRNIANVVMDLDDTEVIEFNALGGADNVIVNDLSGTDVNEVNVRLAGTLGGSAGDGAADSVSVAGTAGNDSIQVVGAGSALSVLGLAATVNVSGSEGANDSLVISAGDGDDTIAATTLPAAVSRLTLDGGAGNDRLFGSQGADVMIGGDGDDFLFGDNGNDLALMGAGHDVFQWDPGDGNDTLEGQDGIDKMLFFGSNASETINVVANGGRVLFLRDVANVTMDLNDVEQVDFRALGGADNVIIGDLSGTDVTEVSIDLRGPGGAGDGAADTVTQNGTNGNDTIVATSSSTSGGTVVTVTGLQADTRISHADAALDRLVLNGQGGNDVIDASGLAAGVVQLTMNGGLGQDVFIGSAGNDLIFGGDGDDVALMGAGDDTFVWNPGDDDDVIEGQAGTDTMLFNGANVAENIEISANGGRAIFFRNVANVVMDLNDTEIIDFNAFGGADQIVVNDLSGTDVTEVRIDLAAAAGGGDGAADRVVVNGTHGDDVIQVVRVGNTVEVLGLAARVVIENFEASNDTLVINALAGDDVVDASGLTAGSIQLVIDGGLGNDVLIGGDGDDVIFGGEGDDVLVGGPGNDILDGGPGDDIEIP